MRKIHNIPASCSFADSLAELFLEKYSSNLFDLSDVQFILPNRRACQTLKEAFVRARGVSPLMLPKIMSIGDVEEAEVLISGFSVSEEIKELLPAVENVERIFLLAKLIVANPKVLGLDYIDLRQAVFLAQDLAGFVDMINYKKLNHENLQNLVPEEYASHWQQTLKFLNIITEFWPQILQDRGVVDSSSKFNQLLRIQAKIWKESNSKKHIVAAGRFANYSAIYELLKTILGLENGEIYLNGLDKFLDEESWDKLDEAHPEFELKQFLDDLRVSRFDIDDIVLSKNEDREKMISEVMRPAETSDKWRALGEKGISSKAWEKLKIVQTADSREEALAVSLIMREVINTPEKTASLITSDRNLARRVAIELEKWNIQIDDSAGKPLSLTPVGVFLRLIAQACKNDFKPVQLLALLKHPFSALGMSYGEMRSKVRAWEKDILRNSKVREIREELTDFADEISNKLRPLVEVLSSPSAKLQDIITVHIEVAVSIATTDDKDGNSVLWKGEAGEAAASLFADVYEYAKVLGDINPEDYLGLIEAIMSTKVVRASYGTHPRLRILGPIESRLNSSDVTIIGGTTEGIWPKLPSSDPWMSRTMKRDFGYPLPEQNIGIMAKDFADLMAGSEVYITYANRVDGTPTIKSRWLLRLETVLQALGLDIKKQEDKFYSVLAKKYDELEDCRRISEPRPCPPVSARPRKFSVSAVESLMRDPYIVFAKYILKLYPLEEIERDLTAADYGNIIHAILDSFNKKYPNDYPKNARQELINIGREYFEKEKIASETLAFWWPKFEKIADWLVEVEEKYRQDVKSVHSEIKGQIRFDAPAGEIIITAKADRVDINKDGTVSIVDYKTGQTKSAKEVRSGYAPQLPLEGLIAKEGGYDNVKSAEIRKLLYWKLADKEIVFDKEVDEIISNNFERVKERISSFDFETTAYTVKPNPKYVTKNTDYEHLSRFREWSVGGESNE